MQSRGFNMERIRVSLLLSIGINTAFYIHLATPSGSDA